MTRNDALRKALSTPPVTLEGPHRRQARPGPGAALLIVAAALLALSYLMR